MAKLKAAEKLLKMGVEAVEKGVKQFSLPKAEKPLRKSADTIRKEELVDVPKPLSKTAQDAADRQAKIDAQKQTIVNRKLAPGENKMPFVNPSEEELGLMRRMDGGYTGAVGSKTKPIDINTLTPEQRLKESKRDVFDPGAVGDILAPVPKKRPKQAKGSQFDLPRQIPTDKAPTSQYVLDLAGNADARKQIMATIKKGLDMGAGNWYDTGPLREVFLKELGPQEGEAAFKQFISLIGPTSAGSDVGTNIKQASNLYSQARSGRTDPFVLKRSGLESFENPPPEYGHPYQQNMMESADVLREKGQLSSVDNPKIASFVQNLMGNWDPATLDRHALRLMGMMSKDPRWLKSGALAKDNPFNPAAEFAAGKLSIDDALKNPMYWQDVPAAKDYGAMEQYWKDMAKEMGISPAEAQAAAWVGGSSTTGVESPPVPFIDVFKDRLRRTAIRDNVAPADVLKMFIQGRMTLAELMQQEQAPGAPQIG
jgi:hypothetical protein